MSEDDDILRAITRLMTRGGAAERFMSTSVSIRESASKE